MEHMKLMEREENSERKHLKIESNCLARWEGIKHYWEKVNNFIIT